MAEDLGERTEMPTARRRSEARESGQTGKSADLASALVLCGALCLIVAYAGDILEAMAHIVRGALDTGSLSDSLMLSDWRGVAVDTAWTGFKAVAPIMVLMAVITYASQLWQVGFIITTRPLEPRLDRLNFIGGFKKFFSLRSTVKGGLDLLKLGLMLTVVVLVVRAELPAISALAALDITMAMAEALRITLRVAIWVLVVLLILGIIDMVYQRWQTTQDLKMTKQEVKEEMRASEGDMEVKGRRLRMARQMMMQRLGKDVPKADVIVTNPTHYSVALAYDQATMRAPKVVAKGADYLALKIRYIAAAHGVPIVERPPLARALYSQVEVGREVNAEHYEAVAEVLAYVYRLEGRMAG